MCKIGIGVSFRNRLDTTLHTIEQIKKFMPIDANLVLVDDASDGDTGIISDFRFDTNVGVSTVKNKCLELLEDCEYSFLFDNDCYPIKHGWHFIYIESGLNHACFTFDRPILNVEDTYIEFEKPNGCMMFIENNFILKKVGGLDTDFKGYGFDHLNWSDRIFNNGLTPARYVDVHNSSLYFKMADVPSTFSNEVRARTIPINQKLYKEKYLSTEFKPYK